VDIAELDRESAELLPDRQALGCWNYGWHGGGYGYGYGYSDFNLGLNLNLSLGSQFGGFGL
jgi:hypothetical protein